MKLTKKKAISECKELWKEIKESGLSKEDFLGSEAGKKWDDKYLGDCPLCEYDSQFECDCSHCPLGGREYEHCRGLGYRYNKPPYPEWLAVIEAL